MAKKYTAQCACGSVKFEFDIDPDFVAVCHCLDCKKASGGEAATFFGVPKDDFTLTSGSPEPFRYVAESGKTLDRNFCPECGARVHEQTGKLPRRGVRDAWEPGRSERDCTQSGDVRQAPTAVGGAARFAAV